VINVSWALVATSVVGTAWCAWRTRAAVRRWHWFSFFGLACVLSLCLLANWVSTSEPAMLGLLALDALALACAAMDLARRQYGTPGRIVAWMTCVLSIALGALAWSAALERSGVIGRWLRHG
jgi:hypothetical protein